MSTSIRMSCLIGVLVVLGLRVEAHHGRHEDLKPTQPTVRPVQPQRLTRTGEPHPSAVQLLEIYECIHCHRLKTPHRLIGPSLWKIRERADAEAIRASILQPDAVVEPGYPRGLMRTRLQQLGFYEDVKRQPAILERLVAHLSGRELPPSDPMAPLLTQGMVRIRQGVVELPDGRRVEVPAFVISATPVTYVQYERFIAAAGYTTKRYWQRAGWAVVVRRRKRTHPQGWRSQRPKAPVVGVTWYEADAYCRWSGKSLPTEMQWERACRDVAGWFGSGEAGEVYWEWTAEAVWRGGTGEGTAKGDRCVPRIASYPALDGRNTTFRCVAGVDAAAP